MFTFFKAEFYTLCKSKNEAESFIGKINKFSDIAFKRPYSGSTLAEGGDTGRAIIWRYSFLKRAELSVSVFQIWAELWIPFEETCRSMVSSILRNYE